MKRVFYEWDVEVVTDDEFEDIEDHFFCDSFAEAFSVAQEPEPGFTRRVVLVRDDGKTRAWAYLQPDGTLPAFFSSAYVDRYAKVPRRFVNEVKKGNEN